MNSEEREELARWRRFYHRISSVRWRMEQAAKQLGANLNDDSDFMAVADLVRQEIWAYRQKNNGG